MLPVPLNAAEPVKVAIPDEIQRAVGDLSSQEFTIRQAAEKALITRGASAFEPLLASLNSAPPDAGQHILQILEQIWVNAPQPQADSLERQLEDLRLTLGPYQPAVARILSAHHRLREQRAVRALRRLNAIIETTLDDEEMELLVQMGQPLPNEPPERISQIILPRSWKGTEADLWHIQRLSHLGSLHVFVIENNGISEASQQRMRVGFPDLLVSARAEVFIGVVGSQFDSGEGCHVQAVQTDSPAETAGLQPGDLILSVDGVKIANFTALVDSLKTKRGYQPIELKVDRGSDYRPLFDNGLKDEPLAITVIGIPWEARRFPTPPAPPTSESLIPELPFSERHPLPEY